MIKSYNDPQLINMISELSNIKAMQVTTKSCIKSGFIVGAAAALGGLLLGPRGIALGGIIAGIGASAAQDGEFRSVPDILMNDLTDMQKHRLAESVRNLLTSENIMTVAALSTRLMSEDGVRVALELIIKNFLQETFNYCM